MVLTLAIPARQFFGLKELITMRHIENMCKVLLGTGLIVGYAYAVEFFTAWYSGVHYERFAFMNRALGPYKWAFALMVFCNVIAPQLLWSKKLRKNLWVVMFVAMCVNAGMWFERFVIIVTSLTRDFLPSSWWNYGPTWVDLCMFAGSFGLFFTFFLLFVRFLPVVAMAEVKTVMPQAHLHPEKHDEFSGDELHTDYRPGEHYRKDDEP
jgi:molybdopterin-containing oxidoreductase family membrane subunit